MQEKSAALPLPAPPVVHCLTPGPLDKPDDLCRLIVGIKVKNVVVYLEEGKTRFYRDDDLVEELGSYQQN